MLVEVNLLSPKERKDVTKWFLAGIIIILFFCTVITIKVFNDRIQKNIALLESERAIIIEELTEIEQVDQEKPVPFSEQLEITISNLEKEVIPGSQLLNEIVRLLPEYGYLLDFNFDHPDTVTFQARFDQLASVAAYNYALTESQYIDTVTLYSINTETIDPKPEETGTSGQAADAKQVGQIEAGAQFGLSEPAEDEELELEKDSETEFLPRYIAYFELKVDRSAFLERGDR